MSGPPPDNSLLPQQFYWDTSNPASGKIWAGVPASVNPAGRQLVIDTGAGIASGTYLPLAGGVMAGPLVYTATGGAVPRSAQDRAADIVYAADYASIQAAINALPATGGTVMLASGVTYTLTAGVSTSKPNVTLTAPGWGTVIRRDPTMTTGVLVNLTGAGSIIENITVDGNSVTSTNYSANAEVVVSGANSLVRNCQVLNSGAAIAISLGGAGCQALNNTITGLGINLGTETGYGIWAQTNLPSRIVGNTIRGTCVAGIGVDGPGSVISDNYLANCYHFTRGGGQIYSQRQLAEPQSGIVIANNYLDQGGGPAADGIEVNTLNTSITGNVIVNQQGYGILVDGNAAGITISGNIIMNCGQGTAGASIDGINIVAGATNFSIVGNIVTDNQATKTMRGAINVLPGPADNYTIAGNICAPNNRPNFTISDSGTGTHKVIRDNQGVDDYLFSISVASPLTLQINPVQTLGGTGTITSITTVGTPIGRAVTILPTQSGVVFTGGAGAIANTVTTVANVPVIATFNGTSWFLK